MQVKRDYNRSELFNGMFYYSEDSPSGLSWKKNNKKHKIGTPVGRRLFVRGVERYWVVDVDGKTHVVHRVIWSMLCDIVPEDCDVDHINQDGFDNRISNLRVVSKATNAKNCKQRINNTSGVTGVCEAKANGIPVGYRSETTVNGVVVVKQFNFSVHGVDGSFEKAVTHRKSMLELDGNYTELHGT